MSNGPTLIRSKRMFLSLHSAQPKKPKWKCQGQIVHLASLIYQFGFFPPGSEASSCTRNQVFLYNLTKCQQTCRSLADGEKYCLQDFAPVDGCGCPPNTYLDNQDNCVPISQCPCYYKGSYLEPGQYVTKDGERWYVLFWLFLGVRCLAFFVL